MSWYEILLCAIGFVILCCCIFLMYVGMIGQIYDHEDERPNDDQYE
jgi:large-conductance mechanosensitive channel